MARRSFENMLSPAQSGSSSGNTTPSISTTEAIEDAVKTTETTPIASRSSSSDNVDAIDDDTEEHNTDKLAAASRKRKASPSFSEPDYERKPWISLEALNSRASLLIYSTLKAGEIRIVKLHPGERGSPIHCSLTTFEQANAPDYEALSYVWGTQTDLDEIFLDGEVYKITQNLGEALLQLRSTEHDRLLWIDALAINQADILERNHQVHNMRTIYASAITVLVWLGHGDYNVERTFELMISPKRLSVSDLKVTLYAIRDICCLPYWTRVWVVQEIAYARSVLVMYGYQCVPYLTMLSFWKVMHQRLGEANWWEADPDMLEDKYWLEYGGPKKFVTPGSAARQQFYPIRHWLNNIERMKCHDPRDRIFAYYGCFSPDIRDKIIIDYSKSAGEVFWQASLALIETTGNLNIIAWGDKTHSESNTTPTWAANFSDPREEFWPGFSIDALLPLGNFYHILNDRRILQVKGACFGSINKVGPTYHEPQYPVRPEDLSFLEHISRCWKSFKDDPQAPPSNSFLLTVMRGYRTYSFTKDQDNAMFQLLKETAQACNGVSEHQTKFSSFCSLAKHSLKSAHIQRPMFSFSKSSDKEACDINGTHFGLGEVGIAAGDKICVILGCAYLLILRQVGKFHRVVGNAVVREEIIPDIQSYARELVGLEEYLLQ